ncbi:hypothetical protein D3C84_800600 [compost metagenome]
MLLEHRRDHGLDRLLVADIADLQAGAAAVLADLLAGGLEFLQLAPDQHHMGAQGGQLMGGAAADAAAAAGDQNGLAGKQVGLEDRVVCHCSS